MTRKNLIRKYAVITINKPDLIPYYVSILLITGWQVAGAPSMAFFDNSSKTSSSDRQLTGARDAVDTDHNNFSTYSYGSAEFRNSLKLLASNSTTQASGDSALSVEAPVKLETPATTASLPTVQDQSLSSNDGKIFDPCQKVLVDRLPPPATRPMALESVKDRDPELYRQIQAKVDDPRYTGEIGNITVSTHDKKGRVNGCTFIQNVPYWQSGPAAQALVDVNIELGKIGKRLETDPLNGAGRTLGQEEAIVWRNSGLHAKVGKSNHGFGRAVDFKTDPTADERKQIYDDAFVNATLHAHGWRQGDTWGPLKNDLHHWSFTGPGPAHDGPPPSKPKPKHGPR